MNLAAPRASHNANRPARAIAARLGRLTIFEQVLLLNSCVILASTLLVYWVTHAIATPFHDLLDTLFIALDTLLSLGLNALVLRHAFRPLAAMTATISDIEAGNREQRVATTAAPSDIAGVADAFNAMLDALEAGRQSRLREITEAQEAERRRIALELHDATGQELTALLLRLELLQSDLDDAPDVPPGIARGLEATKELAERTLRGVQRLALHLRPSVLDHMGLSAALEWLVSDVGAGTCTPLHVTVAPVPSLDPLTETMLFRVAQEALSNALRHSGARTIRLTLAPLAAGVRLGIADDGHGFDPTCVRRGTGLSSMRERMEMVGGTLTITTTAEGTQICAEVPHA